MRLSESVIEPVDAELWDGDVYPELIQDLSERNRIGWENHGIPLMADKWPLDRWLQETFDEAADKLVYLKAAIKTLRTIKGWVSAHPDEPLPERIRAMLFEE